MDDHRLQYSPDPELYWAIAATVTGLAAIATAIYAWIAW